MKIDFQCYMKKKKKKKASAGEETYKKIREVCRLVGVINIFKELKSV